MSSDQQAGFQSWCGHALVVGSGGIGLALVEALLERAPHLQLWASNRSGVPKPLRSPVERAASVHWMSLDLTASESLQALHQRAIEQLRPLRLVINASGVLHGAHLQPEKRLSQVTGDALDRCFRVNAFGPLLLAQAVEAAMPMDLPVHFASLSARVGSIGDNQLGGWYSYRGAKAAQNQLLHTLALEWRRRRPLTCVTLLHPGTTATPLSEPFRSSVPPERLFSPERAAQQLLDVLQSQHAAASGRFVAWDGQEIPW
ncbi:MAG: SDR family NAD(P)-dependent oxidoreductase [Cyanobacteriota bacterium]|nr:SDR family NAD(P)-dependent oxidoreductase [Cyanobacteriota bacterium]